MRYAIFNHLFIGVMKLSLDLYSYSLSLKLHPITLTLRTPVLRNGAQSFLTGILTFVYEGFGWYCCY